MAQSLENKGIGEFDMALSPRKKRDISLYAFKGL